MYPRHYATFNSSDTLYKQRCLSGIIISILCLDLPLSSYAHNIFVCCLQACCHKEDLEAKGNGGISEREAVMLSSWNPDYRSPELKLTRRCRSEPSLTVTPGRGSSRAARVAVKTNSPCFEQQLVQSQKAPWEGSNKSPMHDSYPEDWILVRE